MLEQIIKIIRDVVVIYGNKIIESFMLFLVLTKCFSMKEKIKYKKTVLLICTAVSSFIITYITDQILHVNFYQYVCICICLGIAYSFLFLKKSKIYMKTFLSMSVCVFDFMTRFLVSFIRTEFPSPTTTFMNNIYDIIFNLTGQLLLALLAWFLIKNTIKTTFDLPAFYWIIMNVVVLADFVISLNFVSVSIESNRLMCFILLVIFVTIMLLYYLFSHLSREYEEKLNYKSINQQITFQKNYFKETAESQNKLRSLRHELKNHIFCMNLMIEQGQYDKLHEYFEELYKSGLTADDIIESGNTLVNAVLSQKALYAKSLGIDVHVQAFLPEHIGIKDSDLCSVISNLFDNAIEAAKQMEKPSVSAEIKILKSYISIVVRNTSSPDVLKVNSSLQTTKKDKENHGIGIKVIKAIAKKYDGMASFVVEESEFIASVMLKHNIPAVSA